MRNAIFLALLLIGLANFGNEQGCVIVRHVTGFGQYNEKDKSYTTASWLISVNNRYFNSKKLYAGSDEIKAAENTNIIKSFGTDISVTRFLAKGWSITLDLTIG
ncbi:MAG: hypothetical protein ACHQEM_01370 [Chitinophagales bacterium]